MKVPTVGTKVTWSSMAHGSVIEKHGTVVLVIPPNTPVNGVWSGGQHSIQFDVGGSRPHESYLVEVLTGKDGRGVPKLYWPRVSALHED